jgi:hypothetical protein
MDLFSTLTFFPLVLQIALSGVDPAGEQKKEKGSVKKVYGVTAPY